MSQYDPKFQARLNRRAEVARAQAVRGMRPPKNGCVTLAGWAVSLALWVVILGALIGAAVAYGPDIVGAVLKLFGG